MADQEVIKHTKKIYRIWNSKEHSFWHKAKEFILEILIIVFAVSLSIWLHGRSEHTHQQQEAREFLLGLQNDLRNDITEMNADRQVFIQSRQAFVYIRSLQPGMPANADSIRQYQKYLFNETGLVPNSGRFEGFKSAGKIGTIEHPQLQNDIMDLYQENIPFLILNTNYYSREKGALRDYFNKNQQRKRAGGTSNFLELFSAEPVFNMSYELTEVDDIVKQYDKCMANMNAIILQIDAAYKR